LYLVEDFLQDADPRRERVAIVIDRVTQQPRDRFGLFVGEVKDHASNKWDD